MEPEGQDDPKKAPPVELSDALYSDPAPGGARRNCGNCVLWASKTEQCSVMERTKNVPTAGFCGHHIYGAPSKLPVDFSGLHPVDPRFSGYRVVQDGVACENCNNFVASEEEDGVCAAVTKRKRPAHVHPKGFCTLWVKKEPVTDPKKG